MTHDTATLRFADYATSGAFQIGLTRGQIATLMQIAGGDYNAYPHMGTIGALERKRRAKVKLAEIAAGMGLGPEDMG